MMHEYTTNFDDFKAAQQLFAGRNTKSRVTYFLWLWVLPALGVIALMLLIWDITMRHFGFTPIVGGALAGLAWLGLYCRIRRPYQVRKLYKLMKNGRADDSPLEAGVEGDELISRVPGLSEGRFRRAAVLSLIENDKMTLLVVTKKSFLLFPKRTLPHTFFFELRSWFGSSTPELR